MTSEQQTASFRIFQSFIKSQNTQKQNTIYRSLSTVTMTLIQNNPAVWMALAENCDRFFVIDRDVAFN